MVMEIRLLLQSHPATTSAANEQQPISPLQPWETMNPRVRQIAAVSGLFFNDLTYSRTRLVRVQ